MTNLRKVDLLYKCGHQIRKNISLSRIAVELRFAETTVCADCWKNKKLT
jgi:hypothetical protein